MLACGVLTQALIAWSLDILQSLLYSISSVKSIKGLIKEYQGDNKTHFFIKTEYLNVIYNE